MTRVLDFIFVLAYRTFSKKDLLIRCVLYMTILIFFIFSPITFFVATLLREESHTFVSRLFFYLIFFLILIICYLRFNNHKDWILNKYSKIKIHQKFLPNIILVIILLAGIGFGFLSMIWVSKIANTYHLDGYLYNHILKWYYNI